MALVVGRQNKDHLEPRLLRIGPVQPSFFGLLFFDLENNVAVTARATAGSPGRPDCIAVEATPVRAHSQA